MAKKLTQEELDTLLVGIPTNGARYVTIKSTPLDFFCKEKNVDFPKLINTRYGYKYKIGDDWIKPSQLIPIEVIEKAAGSIQAFIELHFNVTINTVVDTQNLLSFYEFWMEPKEMMQFKITANEYLNCEIDQAFYHSYYTPYGNGESPTKYINILKNYPILNSDEDLIGAVDVLKEVLNKDIPLIKNKIGVYPLTIVLIPRSKPIQEEWFQWLRNSVSEWVDDHIEDGYINGCMYIIRQENSPMTHSGETGIYPGITNDTCTISNEIEGKNILLIDDIYTHGVNVDEDAIQAVLDNKPKSIAFYSLAKTLKK